MSSYLHLVPYQDASLHQQFDIAAIAAAASHQWPGSRQVDVNTIKIASLPHDCQLEFDSKHTSISCRHVETETWAAVFAWLIAYIPKSGATWLLGSDNDFDKPLVVTDQLTEADILAYLKDQTGGTPMTTIQAQHN